MDESEVINIVSKSLVEDIAWEIEAGGRDCFNGVADDSLFQLSNWQLYTKGDRNAGRSDFFWTGDETFNTVLQLGSYWNILSDADCNTYMQEGTPSNICILPDSQDPDQLDNPYDTDEYIYILGDDTSGFRFTLPANDAQCLTGISGEYGSWFIASIGYTFDLQLPEIPVPDPVICETCPVVETTTSSEAAASADVSDDSSTDEVSSISGEVQD